MSHVDTAAFARTRTSTPTSQRAGGRWAGFVVACLGQMALFLNITQTASTLAPVQQDLHVSSSGLVWMASIYSMMVASFVLSAGTVGDILGRRRIFALGALLLGAGSLTVSLASGPAGVIAGQAIMGVGGAAILPNSLSIVTHMFTDAHQRTRAVGIWVAVSGIGLAAGPIAAGVILEHYSWHAVFLVNVVVTVVVLVLTPPFVSESRHPGRHLDPPGLVLGVVAIGSLNYGVIEGGHAGFGASRTIWAFVVAAVSLVAFILVEAFTNRPMLKLRLFRSPSFATTNVVALVAQYGFVAISFAQVLYFARVRHESILNTGLLLLPLMVTYILLSAVAAPIARRIGFKATLGIGSLLAAAGAILMTTQSPTTPTTTIGILMALYGAGAGLILPPSTAVALISVPHTDGGMASGTVNLFRQVGTTLGATITSTILTSGLTSRLPAELARRGTPPAIADRVTRAVASGASASAVPAGLREAITAAIGEAFAGALHLAVLIPGVGALGAAAAAVVLIRNRPAHTAASPSQVVSAPVTIPEAGTNDTMIHGFVRGVDGTAVGSGTLTLISLQGRQLGRALVRPDGGYVLTAPGAGSFVLIATADGHQPQASTVVVGDAPLGYDVVLSGTGGLAVLARGAVDGLPIADAIVVVADVRGEVQATAKTDESGTFIFDSLTAGSFTVAVNAAAYRPAALPVEVGTQGVTRIEVELATGAVLQGTVRAGGGHRPLADARVTLVNAAGQVTGTATTGDDGSYTFTDLDTGDYTLIAGGYPPVATSLSVNGRGENGYDVALGHPDE